MLGGVDPAEGGMCWDQPGSTLSWYPGWVLLYPSYVEVENSSLVLRQFWRLTMSIDTFVDYNMCRIYL